MPPSTLPKSQLRTRVLQQRSLIQRSAYEQRQVGLEANLHRFWAGFTFQERRAGKGWIAVYHPRFPEADVLPFFEVASEQSGLGLGLPRLGRASLGESATSLHWHRWPSRAVQACVLVDKRRHRFGIIEPAPQWPRCDSVPLLVVLPAVAMQLNGQRLGYGKGCYDRALAAWQASAKQVGQSFPQTLAICWGESVYAAGAWASEATDICIDTLLTESYVLDTLPS